MQRDWGPPVSVGRRGNVRHWLQAASVAQFGGTSSPVAPGAPSSDAELHRNAVSFKHLGNSSREFVHPVQTSPHKDGRSGRVEPPVRKALDNPFCIAILKPFSVDY